MKKSTLLLFPLLLALYESVIYLSNDAYLPALPQLASDFAISNHLAQMTLTAWFLGSCSLQLILGPISDRYGRRPVLLGGALAFILASIPCTLTSNIDVFLIARFLQGASVAAMIVAGYAVIHELFEHQKAIQTLAWMNGITILAPAFGPLFGSLLLYVLSWRWIFALLAIAGALSTVGLFFHMPETITEEDKKPLYFKRVFAQYVRVFLNPGFTFNSFILGFLFAACIAWIVAGPFLVIEEFHYSPIDFGLFQSAVFTFYIIGTLLVRWLIKITSAKVLINTGLLLSCIGGALSLLLAYLYPQWLLGMIFSLMILCFGAALCFPILNRVAIEASNEAMGIRVALSSSLMTCFAALSCIIIGSFYPGGLIGLAWILAVFCGVALLLKLALIYQSTVTDDQQ